MQSVYYLDTSEKIDTNAINHMASMPLITWHQAKQTNDKLAADCVSANMLNDATSFCGVVSVSSIVLVNPP